MTLTAFTAFFLSIAFMWLLSEYARCLALFCMGVSITSFFAFGIGMIVIGTQAKEGGTPLIVSGSGLVAAGVC